MAPKVPESACDLNRAVHLLNLRMQAILGKEERDEIKGLVGICPTPAQAIAWKQAFKRKIAHLVVQGYGEMLLSYDRPDAAFRVGLGLSDKSTRSE